MTLTAEQIAEYVKQNPNFKYEVLDALKTGKRGRPALPDHIKQEREAMKAQQPKGQRGRPKKVKTKEEILAEIEALKGQLV